MLMVYIKVNKNNTWFFNLGIWKQGCDKTRPTTLVSTSPKGSRQSNTTVRARLRVDSVGPTLLHRRPGDGRTLPNLSERYRRWWHANCGRFAHHERDRVLNVRSCDRLPPPYLYGGRNTLLVLSTLFWFTAPLLQMAFFDAVLFNGFYACRFYGTSHVSVPPVSKK